LFAKYLRNEKKGWIPRIAITNDSIGEKMKKALKLKGTTISLRYIPFKL
jgi:hypothetical protein